MNIKIILFYYCVRIVNKAFEAEIGHSSEELFFIRQWTVNKRDAIASMKQIHQTIIYKSSRKENVPNFEFFLCKTILTYLLSIP